MREGRERGVFYEELVGGLLAVSGEGGREGGGQWEGEGREGEGAC